MVSTGIVWVRAPSQSLIPALEAYQRKMVTAVKALADFFAQKMQDEARRMRRGRTARAMRDRVCLP